ncbi:MAG: HAMP domain-containing histidine kinase [Oscillospiraceae bacterium]|nr:HAMP domain-containing histidine kinase [Oscillospiraceae bacterium]
MDTKWKKCKPWLGLLAFVLGVSIVLSNVVSIGCQVLNYGSYWRGDLFSSDYQDTSRFRDAISSYLEDFIAMAVGGPVNGSYTYQSTDGTWYYYDYGIAEDTAVSSLHPQVTIVQEGTDWGYGLDMPFATAVPEEPAATIDPEKTPEELEKERAERYKQQADSLHDSIKGNLNLLYTITNAQGKVLYSNVPEGKTLDGGALPEGYNFVLRYEQGKVTIDKDGKALDVYGDGIYSRDSLWFVPGYENFWIDEASQKVKVVIAAIEKPKIYINANYKEYGSQQTGNQFYHMQQNLDGTRAAMRAWMLWLAVGAALFAVYLWLRKDKARADRWLAKVTGNVWVEAKIVLQWLALVFFFPGSIYFPQVVNATLHGIEYRNQDVLWIWQSYLSEILPYFWGVLVCFWVFYLLFVNDIRYHEKGNYRSLFRSFFRAVRAKDLNRPLQKRLARRGAAETGLMLLGAPVVSILFYLLMYRIFYDRFYGYLAVACLCLAILLGLALAGGAVIRLRQKVRLAEDLGALADQIERVRQGNLTAPLALPRDTDLARMAEDLNFIQEGLSHAVEERTRSERMKVELVTNVSHDLKTPLTSIISYAELLSQEEELPDHVKDYVRILQDKSARLKSIVQDVFDVSKASAGQLPVTVKRLDLGKLLRQTVADMAEAIGRSPVSLRTSVPDQPVMIRADGDRLYRVFQNLLQNALSYSLEGSRIYLTLQADGTTAVACVKNTSREEVANGTDFTARFVRGDESRTDGGSGLGLSIARSFTEACGGSLEVELIADLFVVRVAFPMDPNQSVPEELEIR